MLDTTANAEVQTLLDTFAVEPGVFADMTAELPGEEALDGMKVDKALADHEWLAGDRYSIADAAFITRVQGLARAGDRAMPGDGPGLGVDQTGRRASGFDAPSAVDPGEGLQFGVLGDQRFRAEHETVTINFFIRNVTRHAHDLFLPFEQTQAQTLLSVFNIPLDRFLFTIDFFNAQVPKGRNDRRQKQQHRRDRGQRGKTILTVRCLTFPPPLPQHDGFELQGTGGGTACHHPLSVEE